jgi:UDP-N-acetylmuramate: L-alanyl-gamma-D-glutamyl-meso-diaminopimelate ligase
MTAESIPSSRSSRPVIDLGGVRRIHLTAVAGVGMAGLAGMLKQRGFEVSGSDENMYPPMSVVLERLGIPVRIGYRPDNLSSRPDLVIVGNKVSRDNPEVQALLTSGIPYMSFPEATARLFLEGRRPLVVAGTHGKTTCTAMLAWVLECTGRDPSVLIGGESVNFGGNFKLGEGADFVIEGDEYDTAFFDKGPKFLHYRPDAILLTAVEFDHADIYRDIDAVKDAFRRLVMLLPAGAPLVVAADFPSAVEVAATATRSRNITFGLDPSAEWRIDELRDTGSTIVFRVCRASRTEGGLKIAQPGLINARNALGVYALARELGLGHAEIATGLQSYAGVSRRQELVGDFGGVVLMDDFAHHPTAVRGTLTALRQRHPERRLWALFEPRSNSSRRRVFQRDYVEALAVADHVLVGGVFKKASDAVDPSDVFSPEQLVADLRAVGTVARFAPTAEEISAIVANEAESGDVVVMMSNGDFGGLRRRLVEALSARSG